MGAYLRSIFGTPLTFGNLLIMVASYLLFQYLGRFIYPMLHEWWRIWRER